MTSKENANIPIIRIPPLKKIQRKTLKINFLGHPRFIPFFHLKKSIPSHLFFLPHLTPTIEILTGETQPTSFTIKNTFLQPPFHTPSTGQPPTTKHSTFTKLWLPFTSSPTTLFQAHKTPSRTTQHRHFS